MELQSFGLADKVLVAAFQGTTPRTAGFNSVDYARMDEATLLFTDMLMFIGGGSDGTAGGAAKVAGISALVAQPTSTSAPQMPLPRSSSAPVYFP